MGSVVETFAGLPAKLGVTATDGSTGLYLRATIFNGNGSPVPITAVNLDHKSIGFYRADVTLATGRYFAVYRNFTDAGRTTLDPDREHDQDVIVVHPFDTPRIGVAYDDLTDILIVEVTLSRNGAPVLAPELLTTTVTVYDSDDNAIFSVSDLAPDGQGVFRLTKSTPGLIADRLYYTEVEVSTSAGTVTAQKGFHTTE